MQGWYRVWWRFLSRIDGRHSVFLFRQHLFAWGKIGEICGARGGVMERRCMDENGEEIAEICIHKDLIFRDDKATEYVHIALVAVELLCAFPLVTETGSLHA